MEPASCQQQAPSSDFPPIHSAAAALEQLWRQFLETAKMFDLPHQKREFAELLSVIYSMLQSASSTPIPCRIVYSPRGMGKSTLLRNVSQHLPGLLRLPEGFEVFSTYCSIREPEQWMSSLLTTMQHALPQDHAGTTCATLGEFCRVLAARHQLMMVCVDDAEMLYSESADALAAASGMQDAMAQAAYDRVMRQSGDRAMAANSSAKELARIEAAIEEIPHYLGKKVAIRWLSELESCTVPKGGRWSIMVVLSASRASSRRLFYRSLDTDKEPALLEKYPLYLAVRKDLKSRKYHLGTEMSSGCWGGGEAFLPFLRFLGVPFDGNDELAQEAASVFISSCSGSVRCAANFAKHLALQQHGSLTAEHVQSALRRVQMDDTALTRDSEQELYGPLVFGILTGVHSPTERAHVARVVQAGGFAFSPSLFALTVDALSKASGVSVKDIHVALDEEWLAYTDEGKVGIPSLRHLLSFLSDLLDSHEAACLAFPAGVNGQHAEPVAGRALLLMLETLARTAGTGSSASAAASVSTGLSACLPALVKAVSSATVKTDLRLCFWHSMPRFNVAAACPVLPPGALDGTWSFAKEHEDKYGGDLIAIVAVRGGDATAQRGAQRQLRRGAKRGVKRTRGQDPPATSEADALREVLVWRVQVKLCATCDSTIKPGKGKRPDSETATGIATAMVRGTEAVTDAVKRGLAAANKQASRITVVNSIATTRGMSAASREVFKQHSIGVIDRNMLLPHWEQNVVSFAERVGLQMYFEPE